MADYSYIERNFRAVCSEIDALARKARRDVTLVAVTKSGTDEELLALAAAGALDVGENRPQELARRCELLRNAGFSPRLHEIGNLQRNKVKLVAGISELIHSVGKLSLAEQISREAVSLGRTVKILIEVNSAEEENKGGFKPCEVEDAYLGIRELPGLEIAGLMTMGPPTDDGEALRPYFRLTKEIFDRINDKYGFSGGGILSMGMSNSYAVAIEEGSTLVRVGRRLFEKEGI